MKQWCLLLPTSHIKTAHTAAVDPLSAVCDIFTARQLPDSMIVCTPHLSLYSSGRMHADIVADIPVKTVEHSIASEKCLFLNFKSRTPYIQISCDSVMSCNLSFKPNFVH